MSRRKIKRGRDLGPNEWIFIPPPPEPVQVREQEPERDEEEVKLACELVLLFALLLRDRGDVDHDWDWWQMCQDMAFSRPLGCYSYTFFWSMRGLGDPGWNLAKFREYLDWKWSEFETGQCRREGPRWA